MPKELSARRNNINISSNLFRIAVFILEKWNFKLGINKRATTTSHDEL